MNINRKRIFCLALVPGLLLGAIRAKAECCNFGTVLNHKRITVQRRLPPVISLSGATIKVEVVQPGGKEDSLDAEIQTSLENMLLSSDSHVRVDELNPQYQIHASITSYTAPRIENVQADKTTYQRGTGDMTVVFQITNVAGGQKIASGSLQSIIERDDQATANDLKQTFTKFGQKKNTVSQISPAVIKRDMVNDISNQIASYVVNTSEAITIPLARGGPLDEPNKLALRLLWSDFDEKLETTSSLGSASEDAYRFYNIGVANEAMAYQAQNAKAAQTMLEKANTAYARALEGRPQEKYFLDAQARINAGIKRYLGAPETPASDSQVAKGGGTASNTPPSHGMTNNEVIQMVQAKMDEANILDNIQNEPEVNFDISSQGQLQLARSGVSGKIIMAMKQRVRGAAPQNKTVQQTRTKTSPSGNH